MFRTARRGLARIFLGPMSEHHPSISDLMPLAEFVCAGCKGGTCSLLDLLCACYRSREVCRSLHSWSSAFPLGCSSVGDAESDSSSDGSDCLVETPIDFNGRLSVAGIDTDVAASSLESPRDADVRVLCRTFVALDLRACGYVRHSELLAHCRGELEAASDFVSRFEERADGQESDVVGLLEALSALRPLASSHEVSAWQSWALAQTLRKQNKQRPDPGQVEDNKLSYDELVTRERSERHVPQDPSSSRLYSEPSRRQRSPSVHSNERTSGSGGIEASDGIAAPLSASCSQVLPRPPHRPPSASTPRGPRRPSSLTPRGSAQALSRPISSLSSPAATKGSLSPYGSRSGTPIAAAERPSSACRSGATTPRRDVRAPSPRRCASPRNTVICASVTPSNAATCRAPSPYERSGPGRTVYACIGVGASSPPREREIDGVVATRALGVPPLAPLRNPQMVSLSR